MDLDSKEFNEGLDRFIELNLSDELLPEAALVFALKVELDPEQEKRVLEGIQKIVERT